MTGFSQGADLRYLDSERAEVNGARLSGMLVRGNARVVGRLQGFVIDPLGRQLRYLVFRAAGLFGRPKLVPVTNARVDLASRAIQLDEDVVRNAQPFQADRFPAFNDDDLLTAVFGSPRAA